MCYCDEWFFTIDRFDQFVVSKLDEKPLYSISPEDAFKLIEACLQNGLLKKVGPEDGGNITVEYAAEQCVQRTCATCGADLVLAGVNLPSGKIGCAACGTSR